MTDEDILRLLKDCGIYKYIGLDKDPDAMQMLRIFAFDVEREARVNLIDQAIGIIGEDE